MPTAVFNMDCRRSIGEKWLADLRDAQLPSGAMPDVAPSVAGQAAGNPGWGDAIVTIPYTLWQTYGDPAVIEENYDAMTRWIDFLTAATVDDVLPDIGWGDWTTTGETTPRDLVNTAFYVHSLDQLAEMATALGRDTDADRRRRLASRVRAAFARTYFDTHARLPDDTQAGYALALAFRLAPATLKDRVVGHLLRALRRRDWHLSTGILATPYLLAALSDNGRTDVSYRVLQQDTHPSWGYQLACGATTLWEHWDSVRPGGKLRDPAMNSLNHYIHGAIGDWMYRNIGGINADPQHPGYHHMIIRPRPGGGLTAAYAAYESVRGRIESRWRCDEGEFALEVRIPANTTATVHVPASDPAHVTEDGRPAGDVEGVAFLRRHGPHALFHVGSGRYRFAVPTPPR
jgi:alpha-L-rhamnosidase